MRNKVNLVRACVDASVYECIDTLEAWAEYAERRLRNTLDTHLDAPRWKNEAANYRALAAKLRKTLKV